MQLWDITSKLPLFIFVFIIHKLKTEQELKSIIWTRLNLFLRIYLFIYLHIWSSASTEKQLREKHRPPNKYRLVYVLFVKGTWQNIREMSLQALHKKAYSAQQIVTFLWKVSSSLCKNAFTDMIAQHETQTKKMGLDTLVDGHV